MSKKPIPAIGIDLGTTYSVVAKLDESGQPVTLPNAEGDHITPSVVLFDGEDVVVGREAQKALATEADAVAQCAKREVGYRTFHQEFEGKQYPPEVIEAWVLNKVREDAIAQIGPFEHVVITVPAYFDEVRRKATQDAGYMAGFQVLDIINEPTAAAVAFGYQHGMLGSEDQPGQRVLVYDLGGGTFDVTVMELEHHNFRTLATDGDVQLGGHDWDGRLVDLVAEACVQQHGFDPREDVISRGRLWRECEDAKRTLSARRKVAVACDLHGHSARIEVTREQFEEATQDLLDRTRFTATQTIKVVGLQWEDIDRVLLVGGSTRMPMVREMVREMTGKEPDTSASADEAVAHGAALRAGQILDRAQGRATAFQIKNVNSHSLGVVGLDRSTGRKRNATVIPRNTPIPVNAKRTFRTQKEDQRSILVEIVEGESPSPDGCSQIGSCTVADLPRNLPAGSPVDVIFRYRSNGRLHVQVVVPETGTQAEVEFERENTLSKEDLDGWRQYISGADPTDYT